MGRRFDLAINRVYREGRREARFWSRIERRPNGCWEWTGPRSSGGYGRISSTLVHRYAYELLVGPIPEGLTIDHLCRNRACQNPEHMEPVTDQENRLRGIASRRAEKTL